MIWLHRVVRTVEESGKSQGRGGALLWISEDTHWWDSDEGQRPISIILYV